MLSTQSCVREVCSLISKYREISNSATNIFSIIQPRSQAPNGLLAISTVDRFGYRIIDAGVMALVSRLSIIMLRLMTMSPLYPCGKPCSRGTHNETVKNLALFSSIINGIMMESRLRISVPWECFQFFNRIENSITFTPSQ